MRAKILTLRFCSRLGCFDDAPLIALQQKVVLDEMHEHLVHVGAEAMLVCVARWREQRPAAATAHSVTTDASPAPITHAEVASSPEKALCAAPALDPVASSDAAHAQPRQPAVPLGALRAELDHEQRLRFDRLRAWRNRTAHAEGAPPYVILTNRQLVDLVRLRPSSKQGLGTIRGLGDQKIARRGEAILQLLWDPWKPANEPQPIVDSAPTTSPEPVTAPAEPAATTIASEETTA